MRKASFTTPVPTTKAELEFIYGRVTPLLTVSQSRRPLIDLLANAYAIGLQDAAFYFRSKAEQPAEDAT